MAKSTKYDVPYWVNLLPPINYSFSGPNILLTTLFLNTQTFQRDLIICEERGKNTNIRRTAAMSILNSQQGGTPCLLLHCSEGRSTSEWWRGQGPTTFPLALAVQTEDTSSGIDVIQARLINKHLHGSEGWSTIVYLPLSYLERCFGFIYKIT
jgi:hypothetical protein